MCLIQGLDEVGITLTHEDALVAYEARMKAQKPWLARGTGLAA
jgi:3-isopropylmalate/(R)-2-methylmalate dehydratase small subunit